MHSVLLFLLRLFQSINRLLLLLHLTIQSTQFFRLALIEGGSFQKIFICLLQCLTSVHLFHDLCFLRKFRITAGDCARICTDNLTYSSPFLFQGVNGCLYPFPSLCGFLLGAQDNGSLFPVLAQTFQ